MNIKSRFVPTSLSSYLRLLLAWLAVFTIFLSTHARADVTYSPAAGWNLLGNSSDQPINVATSFGDPSKVTTVWKWNRSSSKWAFFTPAMSSSQLAGYAQTKGYDLLTSIDPKEGFWLNANNPFTTTVPSVNGLMLGELDLMQGWNLAASADNKTPSQLNLALNTSLNSAGKSMVTFWAWDVPASNWKFYAPALETSGGLSSYITTKSYLPFSVPLLASEGFWTNIGVGTAPVNLFTGPSNPINLALTLDAAQTVASALVPTLGATSLMARGSDGTTYQLDISDGALLQDTLITMTPVSSISNLPFNSLWGAVKLEPEGLFFHKDVILTITPSVAISTANQVLFGFSANGEDLILATPAKPFGSAIQLNLQHFSGGGIADGVSEQKAAVLNRIADRVESRLESQVAGDMGKCRQDQLLGGSSTCDQTGMLSVMAEYENSVVKNRITAALAPSASCADMTKANQTLKGYERRRSMNSLELSSASAREAELTAAMESKCREEAIKICKDKVAPSVLKRYDAKVGRMHYLMGQPDAPTYTDAYYEATCGKEEIWVGTFHSEYTGFTLPMQARGSVTFELDADPSTANLRVFRVRTGADNLTAQTQTNGECTATAPSTAYAIDMYDGQLKVDKAANAYEGLGFSTKHILPVTVTCPLVPSMTIPISLSAWFSPEKGSHGLATDGSSFSGTYTTTSGGTTFTNTWTFTKQ